MSRSPLSRRISDLSEWINYHHDEARDGLVRDANSKRAWVRRARQYILLLDPDVESASGGLLLTTFHDLSADLAAMDAEPGDEGWPAQVDRHFQTSVASFAAIDEACTFAPESLDSIRQESNPYFFDLPTGLPGPAAFVLMPFSLPWAEKVWNALKDVVESAQVVPRLTCRRADDLFGHDVLLDIVAAIRSAEVVIADITGRNPNVFYELGIAHTFGRRVVLPTQDVRDIPFDIQRFRHVIYGTDQAGLIALERGVKGALLEMLR